MDKRKKILILVMSCNQEHFVRQEGACRQTWAKGIFEGEYPDVDYYSYTGSKKQAFVDKKKHIVSCTSDDGIYKTFQKTVECLNLLDKYGVKYDYIFRTNTSTVINVGLLRAFVDSGLDENIVYCGELYSIGIPCPSPAFIYARGNSILLSKKNVKIILDWAKYIKIPDKLFADDNVIGNILNTYHILRFEPHKLFLKSYGFAWNACVPEKYKGMDLKKLDNGVSSWGDTDDSYEHLKNFISIQIKTYLNRSLENEKMRVITDIACKKKDDYTEELKFIKDYMDNPKYFYHNLKEGIDEYRIFYDEKKNAQGQS